MAPGRPLYTDEQKQTLVNRAAQVGITHAMNELGYPGAPSTAQKWCKQMGVTVMLSEIQRHAAAVGNFYTAKEKVAVCQKVLDEAYDLLMHGEKVFTEDQTLAQDPTTGDLYIAPDVQRRPVTARTLSALASVIQRTIQTMELLEGRVTDRVEQISADTTDIELAQMINEYRSKNAEDLSELRQ